MKKNGGGSIKGGVRSVGGANSPDWDSVGCGSWFRRSACGSGFCDANNLPTSEPWITILITLIFSMENLWLVASKKYHSLSSNIIILYNRFFFSDKSQIFMTTFDSFFLRRVR